MRGSARGVAGRLAIDRFAPARFAYRAAALALYFGRGYRFGRDMPDPGTSVPSERPDAPGSLAAYAESHTRGPGLFKWQHYFDIYERHLSGFRGRAVNLVEIGVAGGGSLGMWREYLGPDSRVIGIDIDPDCRRFEAEGIEVVIGDQGSREFWRGFLAERPEIDVVIDDGSHLPEHQVVTLESVFDRIGAGGVYVCEDVHGPFHPFHAFLDGLARPLSAVGVAGEPTDANGLQRHVASVHRYPILTVIEKAAWSPREFRCERHGTEWPGDRAHELSAGR